MDREKLTKMVAARRFRRRRAVALLALVAVALVPAVVVVSSSAAAPTPQEREQRAAERAKQREELRAIHEQERQERREAKRRQRERNSGTRTTPFGHVEISCAGVTWFYENFPAGTHTVRETVSIDGDRQRAVLFTFSGSSGSNYTPIEADLTGLPTTRIDTLAQWAPAAHGEHEQHGWDIRGTHACGERAEGPSFLVVKEQHIEGRNSEWVQGPLVGEVGQTIDYRIKVENNGTQALWFGPTIDDPRCDPGTISRGPQPDPLHPGESTVFTCDHKITLADQAAGSYTNVATVLASLEPTGGPTVTKTTNEVVVNLPKPNGNENNGGNGNGGNGNNPGSPSTTNGQVGVLATQSTSSPPASATALPSLSGVPRGCARASFLVTVKAKGVARVVFYLDGHRLRTVTAHSARKGLLTIRVYTGRLKRGVHTLTAKVTMVATSASAKPRATTRSARFRVCAHAAASPRFTG